ncbi:hypothetical protein MNV49_004648 [Pseudohyphozyma bogoriensis]|nr:hypothetical protein MNV49_004648 [Pseudohyphozyma bogoriensis]
MAPPRRSTSRSFSPPKLPFPTSTKQKVSRSMSLPWLRRRACWIVLVLLTSSLYYSSLGPSSSSHHTASLPLVLPIPNGLVLPHYEASRKLRANPLDANHALQVDQELTVRIPKEVRAGVATSLIVRCGHPDVESHCAGAYRVLFVGPSLVSPPWVNSHEKFKGDPRRIRVNFTIHDPGRYSVYAYPEHDKCDHWQTNGEPLYNKMVAQGSPIKLDVVGAAPVEESTPCPPDVASREVGRWISKAHLNPAHLNPTSPYYHWLSGALEPTSSAAEATTYSHIWAPFHCKIEHHSLRQWVEIAKPDNVLFIGDSVIRDFFCLVLWVGLGGPEKGDCTFSDRVVEGGYHTSNKFLQHLRRDGGASTFRFLWLPEGDLSKLNDYLATEPKMTHVVFGVSLSLARESPERYTAMLGPTLRALASHAKGARILVRSSAACVQAIQCYDRIVVESIPGLTYFDVYSTFNNHPGASSDGRHWGAIGAYGESRPELGVTEYALADAMFSSWAG